MNILYDHQIFSRQEFGGISRYHAELINQSENFGGINTYLPILFSNNEYLQKARRVCPFLIGLKFKKKALIIFYINQLYTVLYLVFSFKKFQVAHLTYYNDFLLRILRLKNIPVVITIHDLIPEKFKLSFGFLDRNVIKNRRNLIFNCKAIICVSESTKSNLLELYGDSNKNIQVIYNGFSAKTIDEEGLDVNRPFILFVGKRFGYKNFEGLVEAFTKVRETHDVDLICVGGGKFDKDELNLIKSAGLLGHCQQVNLNDKLLNAYYKRAELFVYPSLEEGFGIPLLEALSNECIVAASNISVFHEVGGDVIKYFDPTEIASMAEVISYCISNKEYIKRSVALREQASKFSWENCARETFSYYQKVSSLN